MKDETSKVSQNKQKKIELVAEMSEKVAKAKGLVFANYQGLTHQQLEKLKRALKKVEAEFVVIKNALMLRALDSKNLSDEEKNKFQQPTATVFLYNDVVLPLKEIARTIKELKMPQIKFGIIDNKTVSDADLLKLSTLPPLEILRAQLLGQMKSPISGLHRALSWNLQRFVITLNAIKDKKTP